MTGFAFWAALFCAVANVNAHEPSTDDDQSCSHSLKKPLLHLVPSGRQSDIEELRSAALHLSERAMELGYHVPPHQLIFSTSEALKMLATIGNFPVPTWVHGLELYRSLGQPSGVLEFVLSGCPTCRSLYTDTTQTMAQISVIAHVLGHNDFGIASPYKTHSDPLASGLKLAEYVQSLYEKVDFDEVSQWFQYLNSFTSWQDYAVGVVESPENFDPKQVEARLNRRTLGDGQGPALPSTSHPTRPTYSGLQFLIKNLPHATPAWKLRMAELFEQTVNAYPGNVHTKTMNEGWATFSMYLLAKHSKYHSSKDSIDFADLIQKATHPSLSNPYFMGLRGWVNLYEQFIQKSKDSDSHLSEKERDKRFVAYAHELMSVHDDFSFARVAFDQRFIEKYHLFLQRKLTDREIYERVPNPDYDADYYVVLSRDPRRIVAYIQEKLYQWRNKIPRISVVNDNGLGRGALHLRHDGWRGYPLKRDSATMTLYVLSQMKKKPVALDTILSKDDIFKKTIDERMVTYYAARGIWLPPGFGESSTPVLKRDLPIQIFVNPDGTVSIHYSIASENLSEADQSVVQDTIKKIEKELNDVVAEFKLDLEGSVNADLSDVQSRDLRNIIMTQINALLDPSKVLISTAPTAGAAMLHYHQEVERRIARAIDLAIQGKKSVRYTATGVRLSVLPPIPQFEFDLQKVRRIDRSMPNAPIDRENAVTAFEPGMDTNSDADGDNGGLLPGDIRKKRKPQPGDGDGDGEDDEGEGEESDQPADQPGSSKGNDPSEIEIPYSQWGKLLIKYLELPNLVKRGGRTQKFETDYVGAVREPDGYELTERMVFDAYAKGRAAWEAREKANWEKTNKEREEKGLKPKPAPTTSDFVNLGFALLEPEDRIVKDQVKTPIPEHKAVLYFVIDLTGSMMGEPQALSKQFVYNIVSVIRANYKHVDVRFIGYDDQAHLFPENKIWRTYLGGGNTDSTGFLLAKKDIEERYAKGWNVYVFGIGDGGSFDTQNTTQAMRELMELAQYQAWVTNTMRGAWGVPEFLDGIKSLTGEYEWFDYAELGKEDDILPVIQHLFRKRDQKR